MLIGQRLRPRLEDGSLRASSMRLGAADRRVMAPTRPLTLMAVHAHPDDEASSTGGILARYSAEGIRTVLVTCTNGELGDAPGGIKPGEPGHDEQEVADIRLGELRESAKILGVTDLE